MKTCQFSFFIGEQCGSKKGRSVLTLRFLLYLYNSIFHYLVEYAVTRRSLCSPKPKMKIIQFPQADIEPATVTFTASTASDMVSKNTIKNLTLQHISLNTDNLVELVHLLYILKQFNIKCSFVSVRAFEFMTETILQLC